MSIRVSIVEDNDGTRNCLEALLNRAEGIECISTYASGEAALKGMPADKPEVALVDINLPGMSGIECVKQLKEQMPSLQVLMVTTYEESDLIFNSLRAGASGYLLKDMSPGELAQAVEQVHAGGSPMSMQIARKVVDHFRQIAAPTSDFEKLTRRDEEILTLLAKGYLYKEIGTQLGISVNTVKVHLRVIYEKLHVQSRKEATQRFLTRT